MQKNRKKEQYMAAVLMLVIALIGISHYRIMAMADHGVSGITDNVLNNNLIGGGYAVTGQISNVGYTSQIFDATNGLPTSDANYILGSSDGYVWIGGYSGIIRYDGSSFERLDTSSGLTSGRGLFEDSKGRIWVATNDNGVVVIDGEEQIHYTYKDGLTSSSIRIFAEDNEGNIYIGTTAGVCYVNTDMSLSVIDDDRINDERVLKLDSDSSGIIYGQTKTGKIFSIENQEITEVFESSDLLLPQISTIMADPINAGKVYIGTEGNEIYYGDFGAAVGKMKGISVDPIIGVHWLSYDCGRVWVSSTNIIGYLGEDDTFNVVSNIPMNSAIEMTTSDFQGNIWVASSTMGVMKLVTNNFIDLSKNAGLPEDVTNVTCLYDGKLYIGTDNCPYIVLFYSDDMSVNGDNYREYTLIKLNGENEVNDELATNKFSMRKKEDFPGWDAWKDANKAGMECEVSVERKGKHIIITTENMGIRIENITVLKDDIDKIYVALTGDQCALTDIRVK